MPSFHVWYRNQKYNLFHPSKYSSCNKFIQVLWYMLINKTIAGVNAKLELCRNSLDSKGFILSWNKTYYTLHNVRKRDADIGIMYVQEVSKDVFKYLGLIWH